MKLSDINKIGVAGGGTMGFAIAFNLAIWGYPKVSIFHCVPVPRLSLLQRAGLLLRSRK
jgi:3-hydroxyacyl-CoA dehydrogenase